MKRLLALMLCAVLALSCACQRSPAAQPSETPAPTGLELWLHRTQERYNMHYEGFAGYLEALCDDVYSGSIRAMLDILPMPQMEAQVEAKRAELAEKYGEDWHYEISCVKKTELTARQCENFAAELRDLAERISVFPNEAAAWSEAQWAELAEGLGITTDKAHALAQIYSDMAAAVSEPKVTRAYELTLTLSFSGGGEITQSAAVYELNGQFVSQDVIDTTCMVINFIYGNS